MKSSTSSVMTTELLSVPTRGMSEPKNAMNANRAEYFTGKPKAGKISVSTVNDNTPLTRASDP